MTSIYKTFAVDLKRPTSFLFEITHSLGQNVMLHSTIRLIDITCAWIITIGKPCEHSLSFLTMCDTTSNVRLTSKDHTQ